MIYIVDTEVPPLEDMSDLLTKQKELRNQVERGKVTQYTEAVRSVNKNLSDTNSNQNKQLNHVCYNK